jgi:integrase
LSCANRTRKPAKLPPGIEWRVDSSGRFQYRGWIGRGSGKKDRGRWGGLAQAKQWRRDAETAVEHGPLVAGTGLTLREAAALWLDGARAGRIRNRSGDPYKPAAVRGYERNLRLRVLDPEDRELAALNLADLRLGQVRRRDLQTLVDRLDALELSPSTIDATINPLRAIYRRAINRDELEINPTRGLELPAVRRASRRIATPAQAVAMLDALDSATDRALWATALYGGLRRGELVGLRRPDVDLASGIIRIRRGWDDVEGEIAPKTAQGRRNVPIAAVLRD